jgi:hypothetical protein
MKLFGIGFGLASRAPKNMEIPPLLRRQESW